ncbi:MAG: prolyl oligopeptidase family serine peptidase [Pseudomonadota bacterium]
MYHYFPNTVATYWMNSAVVHAASIGATLGDISNAAAPYKAFHDKHAAAFASAPPVSSDHEGAAQTVPPALVAVLQEGAPIWTTAWLETGKRIKAQGDKDLKLDRKLSAASKYRRAAALMTAVEWGMPKSAEKSGVFHAIRDLVKKRLELEDVSFEAVTIPYDGKALDGWYFPGCGAAIPKPTLLAYNGFHSSMDWYVQTGAVEAITRRGVNILVFDHPGAGTARHVHGLPLNPETEHSASAALDWLESRSDVNADHLGVIGASFGGYYAIRAAAYEKRFKYAYCWGGWYYWPPEEIFEGGNPDAACSSSIEMADLEDLFWITGTATKRELYDLVTRFHLKDVCPDVTCPVFIIHGEDDAQLTPWHAEQVIERCMNAPRKELHMVRKGEGGTMHCHVDSLIGPLNLLADRVAETL